MRIVVFGPQRRVGAWEGDRVVDLNAALADLLRMRGVRNPAEEAAIRLPSALAGLIDRGQAGLDDAQLAIEHAVRTAALGDGLLYDPTVVTLHAPTVDRPRIGCAAGNFAEHTLGSMRRQNLANTAALAGIALDETSATAEEIAAKVRERNRPRGFWKDFASPRGTGDGIPYPARCELFDYEGEVVVVLGRPARDVSSGQGYDYVWGVSLLNDWSIRGTAQKDSLTFNLSKNFDGAASIGPCILVGNVNPDDIDVETRVNGEVRQRFNTGDMIFSHGEFIEHLSRDFTLLPGDMVSSGTGPGTATDATKAKAGATPEPGEKSLFLAVGDIVEVSSPAIGTLRNRIVARQA